MTNVHADTVVVGAGITGTTAAIFLAEHGQDVVLLDRGGLGTEASGRSGGGVRQQYRLPPERKLAMQAIQIWHDIQHGWGCDAEYIRGGSYRLILSADDYERGRSRVAAEQADGLDTVLLDAAQTREHLPILGNRIPLQGSSYCASDGSANPLLTMQHLGRVAQQKGVRIRTGEAVTTVSCTKNLARSVGTDQAEYRAATFINTIGPWATDLASQVGMPLPIERKVSKILVTQPASPQLRGFISFDTGYLRQAADGNFHIGIKSRPAPSETKQIALEDFGQVSQIFTPLFPFLRQMHIIRAFAGITGWTADTLPIIDKAPMAKNFITAAGYSAHGFCIGPVVGKHLAQWVVSGKRPKELEAFGWDRPSLAQQWRSPESQF